MPTERPRPTVPNAPSASSAPAPAIALTLALTLAGGPALAQSASDQVARAELIEQARAARQSGDHARALELAERAARIQMSTSLRMFIAQEQGALGHYAAALVSADTCAREAQSDSALRNRDAILDVCRGLATDARARVARVTVTVPSPAPSGLRITIAGNVLNEALYGIGYPVDPGAVVVEAVADGRAPFRREVRLDPGGSETVAIRWDAPAPVNAAPVDAPPAPSHPIEPAPTPEPVRPESPPPAETSSGGGIPIGAVAVLGVGVAATAAGVALLVVRNGAMTDFQNQYCSGGLDCDDTAASRAAYSQLQGYNVGTNVAFAVGAAALVGGAAWLLFGRGGGDHAQPPRASLSIAPLAGGAMLTLGGVL